MRKQKHAHTRTLVKGFLLCMLLSGTVLVGPQGAQALDPVPIPELALWESNMLQFGRSNCTVLMNYDASGTTDEKIASTYYDGTRVYYQINTYTGDPSWKYCAGFAKKFYRDLDVLPNNGDVPGYWTFTRGLRIDYERTGDSLSKDAVILLSQNVYARDSTPLAWTVLTDRSREVAYAIMSHLNAEAVGAAPRSRKADLIDQALGHIDQWFISQTAPYMRPFMVGLTMAALIQVHSTSPDPRIPAAVATALEGLWSRTWLPSSQAFMYTDRVADDGSGGMEPSPDLNLLIAPAYAWMYLQTGNTTYRDRGDQVFAGGVKGAWLGEPKQFNQNYMLSFDYVTWRLAATPSPP